MKTLYQVKSKMSKNGKVIPGCYFLTREEAEESRFRVSLDLSRGFYGDGDAWVEEVEVGDEQA